MTVKTRTSNRGRAVSPNRQEREGQGNTFGTCWERACVAASFAADHMPDWSINLVTVRQPAGYPFPADHAFLVVGDLPGASRRASNQQAVSMTLDGLCQAASSFPNSFVVDPWSDVACRTGEFSRELERSMGEKQKSGLRLINAGNPQNPVAEDLTTWARRVRTAAQGLVYHNGHQPYGQQLTAAHGMTPGAGTSSSHHAAGHHGRGHR
jgi:hypothetical protein